MTLNQLLNQPTRRGTGATQTQDVPPVGSVPRISTWQVWEDDADCLRRKVEMYAKRDVSPSQETVYRGVLTVAFAVLLVCSIAGMIAQVAR